MKKILMCSLPLLAMAALPARADEARIPLYQATTITTSGTYVLTRDIEVASGTVLSIQAADVTLDLNGKSLGSTSPTSIIISIDAPVNTLHVKHGSLAGGEAGIGGYLAAPTLLDVDDVQFQNHTIYGVTFTSLGTETLSVSKCTFKDVGGGISYITSSAGTAARIVGNVFSNVNGYAIALNQFRTVEILNNVISGAIDGIFVGDGTAAATGASYLVQGNAIEWLTGQPSPGLGIALTASFQPLASALILDNAVHGFPTGIAVITNGARIAGNVVAGGIIVGTSGGDGVVISGAQNLVEGNQVQGNAGCGMIFKSDALGSAYRNNMLRGNTGGAVCNAGIGTTDNGGNIL